MCIKSPFEFLFSHCEFTKVIYKAKKLIRNVRIKSFWYTNNVVFYLNLLSYPYPIGKKLTWGGNYMFIFKVILKLLLIYIYLISIYESRMNTVQGRKGKLAKNLLPELGSKSLILRYISYILIILRGFREKTQLKIIF